MDLLPNLRNYLKKTKNDWNYITPQEFYEMDKKKNKKKDYLLIDIRRADDFKKGHIAGAKNIYWCDILDDKNLKKLPKNKKIFLICYVGHTSSQVMVLLKLLGYDVTSIKFGMGISPMMGVPVAGWVDYGYPVV